MRADQRRVIDYAPTPRPRDRWQLGRVTGVLAAAALVAAMYLVPVTIMLRDARRTVTPEYQQFRTAAYNAVVSGRTVPRFTGPKYAPRPPLHTFPTAWAFVGALAASVALFVLHRRLSAPPPLTNGSQPVSP